MQISVKLEGGLAKQKQSVAVTKMIPYQWEALGDRIEGAEASGAMENLRRAAAGERGKPKGLVFQDSDLAKYLEAVAWAEEVNRSSARRRTMQECIKLLAKAQESDGYLNTYFILDHREACWHNVQDEHELYVAGHQLEAAVAWYITTGHTDFLEIMERNIDCIIARFGAEEGKLHGYPGHEEIELALACAYDATGKDKYRALMRYFLDARGQESHFFREQALERTGEEPPAGQDYRYYQAHKPVTQQQDAVGHSVRAVYLYSAMADAARIDGDAAMADACRRLWRSIVDKRLYITGGIGSSALGEAFTLDYDLPNEQSYSETCASIGLMFFARRMLALDGAGEYADVMEQAFYNCVLAGMNLEGDHFFYVNPLNVWPEACADNPTLAHVRTERQGWFGCACCPPNLARLLASLQHYYYIPRADGIYLGLYGASTAQITTEHGSFTISQHTSYPWHGRVVLDIEGDSVAEETLHIRVPGWCDEYELVVNGQLYDHLPFNQGYIRLRRRWLRGDKIVLDMKLRPRFMQANPAVRADIGQVALMRGPLVYCLEEIDNGAQLHRLRVNTRFKPQCKWNKDLLGGVMVITTQAVRESGLEDAGLYHEITARPEEEKTVAQFVPYFAWNNRGPGEMRVWLRRGM